MAPSNVQITIEPPTYVIVEVGTFVVGESDGGPVEPPTPSNAVTHQGSPVTNSGTIVTNTI